MKQSNLDISELESGVYFVRLFNSQENLYKKLIVKVIWGGHTAISKDKTSKKRKSKDWYDEISISLALKFELNEYPFFIQ